MRLTPQLALPSERCQELGNDDAPRWRGPLQISSHTDMKRRPAHKHAATHTRHTSSGESTHTHTDTPP